MEVHQVAKRQAGMAEVRPYLGVPHGKRDIPRFDLYEDRLFHDDVHAEGPRQDEALKLEIDPPLFVDAIASRTEAVDKRPSVVLLPQGWTQRRVHSEGDAQHFVPELVERCPRSSLKIHRQMIVLGDLNFTRASPQEEPKLPTLDPLGLFELLDLFELSWLPWQAIHTARESLPGRRLDRALDPREPRAHLAQLQLVLEEHREEHALDRIDAADVRRGARVRAGLLEERVEGVLLARVEAAPVVAPLRLDAIEKMSERGLGAAHLRRLRSIASGGDPEGRKAPRSEVAIHMIDADRGPPFRISAPLRHSGLPTGREQPSTHTRPRAVPGAFAAKLNYRPLASGGVEYQVVLEFDARSRHYTASVPGLPIVVDSKNKRTALKLAREAIALYLEETGVEVVPHIHTELVTVKV
jgi:hypothetical protein